MKPYYEDDWCTIYHGDCREILPSVCGDVLITDPPYGVNLGDHHGAAECRSGYLVKGRYSKYDDTPENYRSVIAPVLARGIEKYNRAAVFGCAPNVWLLPPPAAIGGVYLPAGCGRMCWGFQNLALVLFYGKAPDLHLGSKATVLKSSDSSPDYGHPCSKPERWMTWLVSLCSRLGETVVDPFMGSGSTLLSAKELGRKAIGIEISEEYCAIAVERLRQGVLIPA